MIQLTAGESSLAARDCSRAKIEFKRRGGLARERGTPERRMG